MRKEIRVVKRNGSFESLDITKIRQVLKYTIEPNDIDITDIDLAELEMDAHLQFHDLMKTEDIQQILIRTAAEKVSVDKPHWTYVAARLLLFDLYKRVNYLRNRKVKEGKKGFYKPYDAKSFVEALKQGIEQGIYGKYLLQYYRSDIVEQWYSKLIKQERDYLFTYAGLKLLSDKYLVRNTDGQIYELPQEMYFLIALTLSIPEFQYNETVKEILGKEIKIQDIKEPFDDDRIYSAIYPFVKNLYDILSTHKATVATPTLMNARRPFTQLSSCFVFTVDDDLYDMFYELQKMAQVSKYAGGIGCYIGKIRSVGTEIQKHKYVSSGIIPYVKLMSDTMTYVDQLGMRKGSASVTLDIWHKDILDFLEIKTNAGDERKKAHDVHPAISTPDIFMRKVKNKEDWILFDPYYARLYITEQHIIPKLIEIVTDFFKKTLNAECIVTYGKLSAYAYDYVLYLTFAQDDYDMHDVMSRVLDELKRHIDEQLPILHRLKAYKFDYLDNKFVVLLKGIGLEDFYGEEFEYWYNRLVNELPDHAKKTVNAYQLMKRIITVAFETGEPYIFFRDTANKLNPNKHIGIVYSSNLCHEIVQSMLPTKALIAINNKCSDIATTSMNIGVIAESLNPFVYKEVKTNELFADVHDAGITPVCNLASINLGKIEDDKDLEFVLETLVRALDNVIDLNFYPFYETARTNKLFRSDGIGVSNYHYWLVKNNIKWESDEHVREADRLFEKIAFYSVKASMKLAQERGAYPLFKGSDWSKGILFGKTKEQLLAKTKENENNLAWDKLIDDIQKHGMRNAYLLALMPTGSTSIIIGATPSIDPIFAKYYKEENLSGILPQVPPEIDKYFWHYKTAYTIDHSWTIKAAAARQQWIDQAQSLNLFIDPNNIDGSTLLNWYILAWELGLKTIYYLRSKSAIDIDECESCQA